MTNIGNYTVRVQGQGWQPLTRDVRAFNNEVQRMGMGVKTTKGLAARFVGLNAIVTMGIIKFRQMSQWVQEAIGDFRDFELRMAEVSTILTDTIDTLPALEAGVISLSVTWGKNARDLANGLYDILSAAVDAEDSIRLLNTATKASIAGLTDVSTSVDVFTSILNAYGMEVSQAAQVSDVLFQTVIRGKLRFEDLASAMGYVTPIAANAGVAFEEVAAILATVTRQGLHVDMASRGLALMIQGIVSPASAAADAAREYGVTLNSLILQVKGLEGFMGELNAAVAEHGSVVLPEIIRNMRSLRVAMALAGKEGVLGFAEDLDLMKTAAGRTEEAMTKMMNTQERQVAILGNAMEQAERQIGEAWSGVDIWWKKAKLWWTTFLAGGDATQVVNDFTDNVNAMKQGLIDLYFNQGKYAGQTSLWESLLGEEKVTPDTLSKYIDTEAIAEYLQMKDVETGLAGATQQLSILQTQLEAIKEPDWFAQFLTSPLFAIGSLMADTVPIEDINKINETFEKLGRAPLPAKTTWNELKLTLSGVKDEIADNEYELQQLENTMASIQVDVDWFEAAFADAGDEITKHKENLLSLKNAMNELKGEVETTYTALTGENFDGTLEWEIRVKIDENKLDRFEQFSEMAGKYGMGYMEDYVKIYGELDSELKDAISTIYEYNKATKELEIAEKELQKTLDENLLLIRQNNLEKMKLQLAGMMRRRGNTRAEQKMMKQIDIENLKLRIENMQKEVDAEEASGKEELSALELRYEKAEALLTEYLDTERHNLWLLKDIRDDEVRDMEEDLDYKRGLLQKYTGWYNEELDSLKNAYSTYEELLQTFSVLFPEHYAKMFDTTAIEKMKAEYQEYLDLLEGKTTTTTTTPSTSPKLLNSITGMISSTEPTAQNVVDILRKSSNYYSRSYGNQSFLSSIAGHATGIPFVPAEGLYHLHRGESVVPANQSGGDSIQINVSVTGNTISDSNVNNIAQQIADQVQKSLVDKRTGKTKYRLR